MQPGAPESHELILERLGSGVTLGECTCGTWEMRVGPDAAAVRHETEEDLLQRNFTYHTRVPARSRAQQRQGQHSATG